jgi:hypothetical protein
VEQHDDGSAPRMHDLNIVYSDQPSAALEVTAAADSRFTELWRLINGGGRWQVPTLAGGWSVSVDLAARAKCLQSDLPTFLLALEEEGIREFRRGDVWSR